jgi:shikimate kinase
MDCSVIALGGGTVRYQWNMDVLRGSGMVILLKANLKVLADRVKKYDRPRVNPGTSLEKDISILWKKYKRLYYKAADLVVKTDQGKTVFEEAVEIIRRLKKQGFSNKKLAYKAPQN